MTLNNEQSNWILGKFKKEVIALFGDVQVDGGVGKRIAWRADKVLPNFYRNAHAGLHPPEENPIYVLVPSEPIEVVWPGREFDEVKFGTAFGPPFGAITSAVGIFKGNALLYICLKPLSESEVNALEVGSMGM